MNSPSPSPPDGSVSASQSLEPTAAPGNLVREISRSRGKWIFAGLIVMCSFLAFSSLMKGLRERALIGRNASTLFKAGRGAFACSAVDLVTIKNQNGFDVPGLTLLNASFMRRPSDFTNTDRGTFVFLEDRFLSALVVGSYWQQQSKSDSNMGLRTIDTHSSWATVAYVNSEKVITNAFIWKMAHVQLAVDPADFGRPFEQFE